MDVFLTLQKGYIFFPNAVTLKGIQLGNTVII